MAVSSRFLIFKSFAIVYLLCSWVFLIPDIMTLLTPELQLQILASIRIVIINVFYIVLSIYFIHKLCQKRNYHNLETNHYNDKMIIFILVMMSISYPLSIYINALLYNYQTIFILNLCFLILTLLSSTVISLISCLHRQTEVLMSDDKEQEK